MNRDHALIDDALRVLQKPGAVVGKINSETYTGYVVRHESGNTRVSGRVIRAMCDLGVMLSDPVRLAPNWRAIIRRQARKENLR